MKRRRPARRKWHDPGTKLRSIRNALDMTMREVQVATSLIARQKRNKKFVISPSRLSNIECGQMVPSIHRVAALSTVYHVQIKDILAIYGITINNHRRYRSI